MARVLALIAKLQVVTCVVVPLAGGTPESAPPPLSALLAKHVPILVLHPAEPFGPVRVDGFLADSDLQRMTSSGWETIGGPLPAGGADLRLDQRSCSAIDGVAATPCYASAEAAHGSGPVVYGKAFRTKTRIDLQYWIWYPYNPYSPTVPAGELWQVHEGDWEAVSVITDVRGKPLVAGYSQHGEGHRREWSRVPKVGPRPLVYVALGSHANYFSRGVHRFDPRVVEPLLISLIEQAGIRAGRSHGSGAHRAAAPRPGDRCHAVLDGLRRQVGRGPVPPRSRRSSHAVRRRSAWPRSARALAPACRRRARLAPQLGTQAV